MEPNVNPAHNAPPAKGTPDTQREQPSNLPRTDSAPESTPPVEAPTAADPTPERANEDAATDPSSIDSLPDPSRQTDPGPSTDDPQPL